MAGGAIATALVASGMALTIDRLDAIAAEQVSRLRSEEAQITLAERLRFSGEVLVSTGRGYVITEDPALRAKLFEARAQFNRIDAALRARSSRESAAVVAEVEADAREFLDAQEALVSDRSQAEIGLVRFEQTLLPLQQRLGESLDRLVEQKEAALDSIYEEAARERNRVELSLYGLAAALVLLGLGVTWYFARQTARAYQKEQEAVAVARGAVAARDELIGVLAHDLRNPLGAIMMHAGLLVKTVDGPARRGAASIERIADDMQSLINSMLDVTMIEAGRFRVVLAQCDADRLVSETMEMFGELAAARGVRLRRSVAESGLAIEADRGRVSQILSNIVGNAIKFTPAGGEVSISVDRAGDWVRFAVADDGPGIPAEHLPHVFDRFWRQDESRSQGSGLGLFICKMIVEGHGGEIGVESAPGRGSTFYFTLRKAEKICLADAEPKGESAAVPVPRRSAS